MKVEVATMDLYGTPFLGSWPIKPLSLREIQACLKDKGSGSVKRVRLKNSQSKIESSGIIAMIKSFYLLLAKSS